MLTVTTISLEGENHAREDHAFQCCWPGGFRLAAGALHAGSKRGDDHSDADRHAVGARLEQPEHRQQGQTHEGLQALGLPSRHAGGQDVQEQPSWAAREERVEQGGVEVEGRRCHLRATGLQTRSPDHDACPGGVRLDRGVPEHHEGDEVREGLARATSVAGHGVDRALRAEADPELHRVTFARAPGCTLLCLGALAAINCNTPPEGVFCYTRVTTNGDVKT